MAPPPQPSKKSKARMRLEIDDTNAAVFAIQRMRTEVEKLSAQCEAADRGLKTLVRELSLLESENKRLRTQVEDTKSRSNARKARARKRKGSTVLLRAACVDGSDEEDDVAEDGSRSFLLRISPGTRAVDAKETRKALLNCG